MSTEYPKIQSVYKRDDRGQFIDGAWSTDEIGYLADSEWLWTEKVDGTNIRLSWEPSFFDGNEVAYIAGRTDNAQIPPRLLSALVEIQKRTDYAAVFDGPVTLYGEGYGAGIQKGGVYRPDPWFVLFDVKVGDWWLRRPDVEDVATKLGLDVVSVVLVGTVHDAIDYVKSGDCISYVAQGADVPAEGVVGVTSVPLFDRHGRRISTKVKVKDFTRRAEAVA